MKEQEPTIPPEAVPPSDASNLPEDEVYSQFTYTLYSNGDWENQTTLTQGTTHSRDNGHWEGHPKEGDIKHRESVWRQNVWADNVIQYY